MAGVSLAEKVLRIEVGLTERRIPHAFGGAVALAYYATPRATIDIDVNVFVGIERSEEVLDVLVTLGSEPITPAERARLDRDEQARIHWDATPIDLFFSYDPFHESCMERRRALPFGDGDTIHVLSAEDLVVFKAIFDRAKDRRDIDEVFFAMTGELDTRYVARWLRRIVGPEDPRFLRLAQNLAPPA